jgi:DNA-binding transcriptional regulator YdaS (Cro superfamily)
MKNKALAKIVKKLGSLKTLGEILGCSKSTVSRWVNGIHPIPTQHIKKLVELSEGGVKKKDLRPDVYEVE